MGKALYISRHKFMEMTTKEMKAKEMKAKEVGEKVENKTRLDNIYKWCDTNDYLETKGRLEDKRDYGESLVSDVVLAINTCLKYKTDQAYYSVY